MSRFWPMAGPPVLRGATLVRRRRVPSVDGAGNRATGYGALTPEYRSSDLERLAEAGANLINLSWPGIWSATPPFGLDESELVEITEKFLDAVRAAGLYATLGFRSGPGRSEFVFHRAAAGSWFPESLVIDRVWHDRELQDAWQAMCVRAARILSGRPEVVGFNPLVEPDPHVAGFDQDGNILSEYNPQTYERRAAPVSNWAAWAPKLAASVRDAAPELPILLSPAGFARIGWLPLMGRPPVSGLVWEVHDYTPDAYTHQPRGGPQVSLARDDADAFAVGLAAAGRFGAPVYLGEFGAVRWAPDRGRYWEARIAACEAAGVNWAAFRWPTSNPDYEALDDQFNLLMGQGADPRSPQGAPAAAVRAGWRRNGLDRQPRLR